MLSRGHAEDPTREDHLLGHGIVTDNVIYSAGHVSSFTNTGLSLATFRFSGTTSSSNSLLTNRFQPDDIALGITGWYANSNLPLMLREIEIYRAIPEPTVLPLLLIVGLFLRRMRQE